MARNVLHRLAMGVVSTHGETHRTLGERPVMQYRIDFEALDWERPMKGVRSRAIQHEGRRLRLVEYTEEMEPHWCERGHWGLILEGYFEIKFENETVLFAPGDGVLIPAGEEHKHMASVLSGPVRAIFVEDA